MVARARARLGGPESRSRPPRFAGGEHEGRARRVDLGRRVRPAPLPLREPGAREVPVLAGLGLVEHDAVARRDERLGARVVARERDLGERAAATRARPRGPAGARRS